MQRELKVYKKYKLTNNPYLSPIKKKASKNSKIQKKNPNKKIRCIRNIN